MIPSSRIIDLSSDAGASLVASLRGAGCTMLVGSGTSSFAPTRLPTGMAIGRAVAERLSGGGVTRRDLLVEILAATAFEHVMERCPRPERVRGVLSAHFRGVRPNPLHTALARLVRNGTIQHVVTTNYDVALEVEFGRAPHPTRVHLVRDEREAAGAGAAPHVLFKIHGCATAPFAHEMVFRLTDEAQLVQWKRRLLQELVAGRPLVVVTYSGMDFEVCPVLPSLGASQCIWLHLGALDAVTPNAWRVLRQTRGVLLQGDVQTLLGALLGEGPVPVRWSPRNATLVDDLFAALDEEDVDAWRARLFGEIGCGRDAVAAASRLVAIAQRRGDGGALARAITRRAHGLYHQGRHFDAARDYVVAARLTRRCGDLAAERDALNGIIESNRCGGRPVRTWLALGALRRFCRRARGSAEHHPASADARMLGLVFRRHLYQVASGLPRRRGLRTVRRCLRGRIRRQAQRDLEQVAAFAAEAGNWLQFQQARLWARRYHLRWRDIYQGHMDPLPSHDGYRQLGYVVARSMAIRDRRRVGAEAEIRELLGVLADVGAAPEAWKLLLHAERCGAASAVPDHLRARIHAGWATCQYRPWMRRALESQGPRARRPCAVRVADVCQPTTSPDRCDV